MNRRAALGSLLFLAFVATNSVHGQSSSADQQRLSDSEIRQLLIRQSIAAYSGACPCPETRNSRGARCGGNSAYNRAGGNRPLCYPSDVTDAMIQRYRER
jgi:hypothetical protein